MKKYSVYLHALAGVTVYVEAKDEDEAVELAYSKASLSECEAYDWDNIGDPDIEEIENE